MVPGLPQCVHVSDIGDTTWNDISNRQQVCIVDISTYSVLWKIVGKISRRIISTSHTLLRLLLDAHFIWALVLASSVAVERVFSRSGLITTSRTMCSSLSFSWNAVLTFKWRIGRNFIRFLQTAVCLSSLSYSLTDGCTECTVCSLEGNV